MSALKTNIPGSVWLIWASQGEYSDRSEWPIAVAMDRETGEAITERLGQLWRELCQIYKRQEDALEDAGDWGGQSLFETTAEGREYHALAGDKGGLGSSYSDERSFTCCEVRVFSAAPARGDQP